MNFPPQDDNGKLILWVVILCRTPNLMILHSALVKVLIILRVVFITQTRLCNNPHQTIVPMPTLASVLVILIGVHQATNRAKS